MKKNESPAKSVHNGFDTKGFILSGVVSILLFSFVLLFVFLFLVEDKTDKDTKKENDASIMSVYVIGDEKFKSTDNLRVIHANYFDDFTKHKFILINYNEIMSYEKQKILYSWILKGKVVAFIGKDIDSAKIPDKLNMPIDIAEKPVGTNLDFKFVLYGYGFSDKDQIYTPVFHMIQSNYSDYYDNIYQVLEEFLLKRKDF